MEKLPTCVQGLINTMDKAIILRHRVVPGLYALVAVSPILQQVAVTSGSQPTST